MSTEQKKSPSLPTRRFASGVVMMVSVWLALFWTAGRLSWIQGWAFLSIFAIYSYALSFWLARSNPELYAERSRIADDVEPWDKSVVKFHNLFFIGMVFVAALDSGRFGWSQVPIVVQIFGWVGFFLSAAMVWRAMAVNNFSSTWARIQEERNQVVITRGSYRFVRHPMYLAVVCLSFCIPMMLASYWALIPGLCDAAVIVYRTYREDRMLVDKLPGYELYMAEVRYRLIPGVW